MSSAYDSDAVAQFQVSREKYQEYPANLVRKESFIHALEAYNRRLSEKGIFHAKSRSLGCLDLYEKLDGSSASFQLSKSIDTKDKLEQQIDEEECAPLWRIIFLQSDSARGPLMCCKEQLMFLLTYYQVMPSFLDLVLTFKKRIRPVAHAFFRHENYLERNVVTFALPSLGRSGIQIQHAFNLLSVEYVNDTREENKWPLRQVALYHSFDVINGRCLWILLKGDQAIAKRIYAETRSQGRLNPTTIQDADTSFVASLKLHLMVLEWCVENWGGYIDHFEDELNSHSTDAKVASVDDMTSPEEMEHNYSRQSTFRSNASRQETFTQHIATRSSPLGSRRTTFRHSSSGLFSAIRRISGLQDRQSGRVNEEETADVEDVEATAGDGACDDDEMGALADLNKEFSFKRFQRLSLLGDELGRALVVIEQNKGVLHEIEDHYNVVIKSYAFQRHMDSEICGDGVAAFTRKIHSFSRDLDALYCRLSALNSAMENDKIMLTAMLQFKSERTAEFFAHSARTSSDKMEDWTIKMHSIAVRTEQETVSMHVITIFTLIFLPGTFIATFFSSGVLNWNDNDSWALRKHVLGLFLSVCLPMMVVIVGGWAALYFFMGRKRRHRLQAALLPQTETTEKAGEKNTTVPTNNKPAKERFLQMMRSLWARRENQRARLTPISTRQ